MRGDRLSDAADFYERHKEKKHWAEEGWLRVKWEQYERVMGGSDPDKDQKARKFRLKIEQEA